MKLQSLSSLFHSDLGNVAPIYLLFILFASWKAHWKFIYEGVDSSLMETISIFERDLRSWIRCLSISFKSLDVSLVDDLALYL